MPDIMICGMDMPEGCLSCNLRATSGLDEWMCMANRMRFPSWEDGWNGDKYRHVDCPLVELPPHGDLILKDDAIVAVKLLSDLYPEYRKILAVLWDQIKDLTVIIPESEEVTNDPKP